MVPDTFDKSLWHATAPSACATPPLNGDFRADIAIVGAGFLALSCALHLAELGSSVAVVEAHEPGFGASGRNTGFVVPSFVPGIGPRAVCTKLGQERGEHLCRLVGEAGRVVFGLIRKHQIPCEPVEAGWLQPAHTPAKVALLEERQAEWAAVGKALSVVGREEAIRLTGAAGYYGALLDPTGGHVNPLGYARGLAAAAMAAGARIHGNSPAQSVTRENGGWSVVTPRGKIQADRVIFATNAMAGGLLPEVSRSLLSLGVYQVATESLEPVNQQMILPENHCVSDTRRNLFAFRWAPGRRLVTGGAMALNTAGLARAPAMFSARLHSLLQVSGPCEISFTWHGVIAMTTDWLPRVFDLGRGALAVVGCCGRGLALTTTLGKQIASYLTDGREADLPVPLTRPAPIRARSVAMHLLMPYLFWARFRDWTDVRFAGTTTARRT